MKNEHIITNDHFKRCCEHIIHDRVSFVTTFISDEGADKRGLKPKISEHKKQMVGRLIHGQPYDDFTQSFRFVQGGFHYFSLETSPLIETVRRAVKVKDMV